MLIKKEEGQAKGKENLVVPVSHKEKNFLGSLGSFFLEAIKLAILSGITIGLVRYFLFKPFYVRGQSMEPAFFERDYLIIDELSYRFREPKRGEVVVFKAPNDSDYYLKRVIGLPGERIKIESGKVVIYNDANPQGLLLDETYLEEQTSGSVMETLGKDEYFLLGDNRDASYDSRRFGPINVSSLVGRAWLRGWPISRIGALDSPSYN
jgi:signal peptidase I